MKTKVLLSSLLLCFVLLSHGQPDSSAFTGKSTRKDIPVSIKNSKAFKRAEWFNTQRAFPYDTIPRTRYAQEMDREIRKAQSRGMNGKAVLNWSSLGPTGVQFIGVPEWGIVSGRVRAIAIHPTDPLTVYIGAASGGIWKTIDGGQTWQDIGHGLESLSFGAIAIDPNNPETIYAGSGESCYLLGFIGFDGKGIFKSTDGGASWNQITNGIGTVTNFGDLAVSPFNSDLVIGAMASGYFYSGDLPNEGIWRSNDAGQTWTRTLAVQDAYDIVYHPTDANRVYAAVGGGNNNAGFYISTNQGLSWVKSNFGLPQGNSIHRIQIDISQSNPGTIYAVIFNLNTMSTSAYKSINGGTSWAQISAGTNLGGFDGSGWYDQGFYDLCIAVDPVNPNYVLIGNVELHRTTNGSTFTPVRPYGGNNLWSSLAHCDYHKLVFAPSNPNYLYIGCDGGIYKSTDKGYTGNDQNQGLQTMQFYRMGSHPLNPQKLIGGMQDNGTAMTTDGGSSWVEVTGGDGMECLFSPNPDTVYASAQCGYLFRSINGGASFGFLANINGAWITPLLMHPTNHKTLYAANKSILRSTNGGNSFQVIASNVAPEYINTMAQSQVNPNNMIFATGCTQAPVPGDIIIVKVSTNAGVNWTDVTDHIPGEVRWISRVVTDPADANTMYVLRTGFSQGNKVWKSADLGQTWTNLSGDLPDLPCSDLFIDPENTHHLYVANDIGVYSSTDNGITWEYASEGMPFVPGMDFDYVNINSTRYLRVGTFGRSIYETTLPHYCLPQGITFTTQAEIDNFQINYPGCTEIEGNVRIGNTNGTDITNLNGLSVLTSIGGSFRFFGNHSLENLSGLDNLTSIGGDFQTYSYNVYGTPVGNGVLNSLSGLEGLASIGGDLRISYNNALTSLTGLNNLDGGSIMNLSVHSNSSLSNCAAQGICDYLASPNGVVDIYGNATGCNNPPEVANFCAISLPCLPYGNYYFSTQAEIDSFTVSYPDCHDLGGDVNISRSDITNLSGLNGVTSIGGSLSITENDSLGTFAGLENLNSIGGDLIIGKFLQGNPALNSLTGLEGLVSVGRDLKIQDDDALTSLIGLNGLAFVGRDFMIYKNNALVSLNGLNALSFIMGDLIVDYDDALTSLTGLEGLDSLNGDLIILENNALISLTGLESITSIGGHLSIGFLDNLTNLDGLVGLNSIGGTLAITNNFNLTSLTGLSGLSSIGGSINFYANYSVTSLSGLENIDPGSISNLYIVYNSNLSTCEVRSVCDYLTSPNGTITISDNAPGCNSPEEVQAACLVSVSEVGSRKSAVSGYPNPFNSVVTFEYELKEAGEVTLAIFNNIGEEIEILVDERQSAGKHLVQWNAEALPGGIYFFRMRAGNEVGSGKMVKY